MSKFAQDNGVFFEFHPHFCAVKSQVSSETLLQGFVGPDGFYSFPSLKLQHPSATLASCYVSNSVIFDSAQSNVNEGTKTSCFGAVGKSDQWRKEAVEYLNCRILSMPFTYLGIPIRANPRRSELWDPVIRKCERKLARWKQRHLSFGGRVTLIQSILTSIPIYFFSFFRVPSRIVDKLVSI